MTAPSHGRKQALPIAVIVLAMLSIAAFCTFFTARAFAMASEDRKTIRDGVACVIEELSAHRVNSYDADSDDAQRHKDVLRVPAPAPRPVPQELIAACRRFIEAK